MNPAVSSLSAIRIRPLQPGDLEQVLTLAASSSLAPQWPRQSYLDLLSAAPPSGPRRISLVIDGKYRESEPGDFEHAKSGVQGFAVAAILDVDRSSELESIVIHPGARNRGLGGRLLDSLLLLASACAGIMRLEVRASNAAAIALYRSRGFRQNGRRPAYYRTPSEDAILFERLLHPGATLLD